MPEMNLDSSILNTGSSSIIPGTLYVVGTPIGNLGDLTPRAAEILAGVDLVAAEDTRRTLRLLNHLSLRKHLESYHAHNWRMKGLLLLEMLHQGRSVALVADAGMPCISDPGEELVRLCVANAVPVTVIPGPCAAIAGLAGSGLVTGRFVFEGFLPVSGKLRKERMNQLIGEDRTLVFYEAPHRLRRLLADLKAAGLAQRQLALGRELTKLHEEFLRLTVEDAIQYYSRLEPRGEFVLILEGKAAFLQRSPAPGTTSPALPGPDQDQGQDQDPDQKILCALLQEGLTVKDAVRRCASVSGRRKNELYQMALVLQEKKPED